jgi:hypothetical protein
LKASSTSRWSLVMTLTRSLFDALMPACSFPIEADVGSVGARGRPSPCVQPAVGWCHWACPPIAPLERVATVQDVS